MWKRRSPKESLRCPKAGVPGVGCVEPVATPGDFARNGSAGAISALSGLPIGSSSSHASFLAGVRATTARKLTNMPPRTPARITSSIFDLPGVAEVPGLGGSSTVISQPFASLVPATPLSAVFACASCVAALSSAETSDE